MNCRAWAKDVPFRSRSLNIRMHHTYICSVMKAKLTLSVDPANLEKARRKLQRRNRTISAEVNALLARIAAEEEPKRKGWIEQFGDLEVPFDMKEAESDSWYGKHLRKTGAYAFYKAQEKKKKRK